MKSVLVACGNGVGSSLIVKMKVESIMKELGVDCTITHSSIGQAKSDAPKFDLIIISKVFLPEFKEIQGPTVIDLVNILSDDEIREKIKKTL